MISHISLVIQLVLCVQSTVVDSKSCEQKFRENIPVDAKGNMHVHHYEANNGKWQEHIRFEPFPTKIIGKVWYVGGNTDGADGIKLMKHNPDCLVHVYEPVQIYCRQLSKRWKHFDRGHVHCYGLGKNDRHVTVRNSDLKGQSTFIMNMNFTQSQAGYEKIYIRDAYKEYIELTNQKTQVLQLIHLNCEGCEWELLAALMESRILELIPIIQVSFHYLPVDSPVAEMESKYCQLYNYLVRTHEYVSTNVPFGWERWVLKTPLN